jgi:DNA polymerase elongation subunit (family B)/predicted RNA-binding Zn-ribbon protein involved in translation (DUF1610 family)
MKILLLDIETSPHSAYVWGLFKQTINLAQIQETGRVLCASYKWLGEKHTHFAGEWEDGEMGMLEELHRVMEDADIIITYNGNRFDLPTLNKEFLLNGFKPPAPYKSVDLYPVVKRKFRFASNKLDHVAQQLGLGQKIIHSGFQMWIDVMNGDPAAQHEMKTYNIHDTVLLERVYDKILPWIPNHPNQSHHSGSHVCPNCGSSKLQHRGYATTAAGKYQRYQCQDCGKWSRSAKVFTPTPTSVRVISL